MAFSFHSPFPSHFPSFTRSLPTPQHSAAHVKAFGGSTGSDATVITKSLGRELKEISRKRMGTPSYLWRPRLAPFATSGCPFYLPERGWARNRPPPRSQGLKVRCICCLFPSFFAVKKFNLAAYIWAPVEGSGASLLPIHPHAPYRSAPPRVLYPEGPELVQGGYGPHFGLCALTACPYMLPPSAVALKGPEPLIRHGVQGSASPPPPQMKAVQGFRRGRVRKPPPDPNGDQGSAYPLP